MKYLLIFCLLCTGLSLQAGKIDSMQVYSHSMKKSFNCVVITPDSYEKKPNKRFPVVYLLHGYSGWAGNWILRAPELKEHADRFQTIIVCPEGGFSSWYFDSPIDSSMRYETYVGKEVVDFIDSHYRTIANRSHRAITGLSMGGHGALFIAWRNASRFGAAGSMSGAVDLSQLKKSYDIVKLLGDTLRYADNWVKYSVLNMVEQKPSDSLALIIDCGTEDFLYAANQNLHRRLLAFNIPHDYTERPGKHDWNYWRNAVVYHLTYFSRYFQQSTPAKPRRKR